MPTDEQTECLIVPPDGTLQVEQRVDALTRTLGAASVFDSEAIFFANLRNHSVIGPQVGDALVTFEIFRLVRQTEEKAAEEYETAGPHDEPAVTARLAIGEADNVVNLLLADFWPGCLGLTYSDWPHARMLRVKMRMFLWARYELAVLKQTARDQNIADLIPDEPDWNALYGSARLFVSLSALHRLHGPTAEWYVDSEQRRFFDTHYRGLQEEVERVFLCSCGRVGDQDSGMVHDDEWICEHCAEDVGHCATCHDTFWSDDMVVDPGGEPICTHCHDRHVIHCEGCGEDFWLDHAVCPNCGEDREDEDSDYHSGGEFGNLQMYSYSYKPEPRFHWIGEGDTVRTGWNRNGPDRIFMGVELETNCPGEREKKVGGGNAIAFSELMQDYGFLYAKSDCTVSGPEIVSHPASLDAHRKLWSMFPSRELAVEHGWSGWRGANAGIHIHIDRQAFKNRAHLARFQMMFGSWRDELIQFSGRNCGSYGHFGSDMQRNAIGYAKGETYPPRGSAINYLCANTVEVRMFRSSLRPETLMAYLEFLHGLVTYSGVKTAYHLAHENAADFERFIEWAEAENNYNLATTRFAERMN